MWKHNFEIWQERKQSTTTMMFLFLLLLTTGGYTTASSANQCRALAPSTGLIKSKYRVGVLAIRGVESAYKEFNHTFSKYLTEVAGKEFDPPISFEAVAVPFGKKENDPLNVLTSESDYYDFVFTNPSMFSCIQSEMGASSLVSIISKRRVNGKVHHLTKFGGVIFTLATNTDINTIADIKGKRVGAVSLSGLGSGQMQFRELQRAGIHHLQDPKQIIFLGNQGRIVNSVLKGEIDVGFVRTDQLERTTDERTGKLVDLSLVKTIGTKEGLENEGLPFPFNSSTPLYPEWNVGNLPHVPSAVVKAVQTSLLQLADHAAPAPLLLDCFQTNNCTNDQCRDMCFGKLSHQDLKHCDTTAKLALLANTAMTNGKHAGFRSTFSYMELRNMQEETGFISTEPEIKCVRPNALADTVVCPKGHYKKTDKEIDNSCESEGLPCYGFDCICSPCEKACEMNTVKIGSNCVPFSILFPSIFFPFIFSAIVLVALYVEFKKRQADTIWRVEPEELLYKENPRVLGRGTFGLVLLAEYRGTHVAVKRVLPPKTGGKLRSTKSMSGSLGSGWRKKVWDATPTHSGITSQFDFVDAGGLADVEEGAMKHQGVQSGWHKVSGFGRRSTDSSSGIGSAIKSRGFGYSNLQKKFVKEMRLLSKLRHPCITTIMGAVISPHCEPMLIMEYMELGSLFDLLHNESLTLEGEILHPILLDIARGIRFLHAAQPQVIHCDLKAQNILVDSKLRAKVSDFGLSTKQNFFGSSITGTPYWMSPELLRGETSNSAASDVYAFGILLYEVFSRKEPYEEENPSEVLELVADDSIGKRPPVPPHCTTEATNLMKSCLLANPVDRPTAKEIDIQLRMFDKAVLEPNDTLQRMGTSNKRDERTQALLWQVFPKHVAAALRDGQKVEPQTFEDTTIFFSDIVDYTRKVSFLTPTQTSLLLDRLYTKLDDLCGKHNVFKVETIGDGYMCVTNLAAKQKDHVRIMANFAIDAMKAASETMVDEEDPSKGFLQLRIGFHSGPVVAHVVGTRNPRYSLIGDTVNVAARMESNSLRGRIHCSEICAKVIQKCGELEVIRRGRIQVKGKGDMITYWVRPAESTPGHQFLDESMEKASEHRQVHFSDDIALPDFERKVSWNEAMTVKDGLIDWNVEVLEVLLREIVAVREATNIQRLQMGGTPSQSATAVSLTEPGKSVFEEWKEVIELPAFDPEIALRRRETVEKIILPANVVFQLKDFVSTISHMYRKNAFHNFEHASHVTTNAVKLLLRVTTTNQAVPQDMAEYAKAECALHDSSFGISSDPITKFAIVFSALIHDADHTGVPNARLVQENTEIAAIYKGKSVAEQNSVDLAWGLLQDPKYRVLRRAICETEEEMQRFRNVVINCVLATDIVDKELAVLRRKRWAKAFGEITTEQNPQENINRKATLVIEHIIQASDVSHMMQHWTVYRKWNERFFFECYKAYRDGRATEDPAEGWYKGEIGFYDFYIIPLAKKLQSSGIFGPSGDEYVNNAAKNRDKWVKCGEDVVAGMVERVKEKTRKQEW